MPDGNKRHAFVTMKGAWIATSCASCGAVDVLVLEENTDTVFCGACSEPPSLLAFPEFYCDLGGEA